MDFVYQKSSTILDYCGESLLVQHFECKSKKIPNQKVKICISQLPPKHSTLKCIKHFEKLFKDEKVNILAFPEMFNMPYPFYTPNLFDWKKHAEREDGEFISDLKKIAKSCGMVIIAPLLESHEEKFYNTCFLISSNGDMIGKYRKHHIPPIEAAFLTAGDFDCPVFETEFGKIGILICYERHFPLKWLTLAQKGAELIFNPSAEDVGGFSEKVWNIEGLSAAVANGVFTILLNRVGEEKFGEKSIQYFGSSYIASPYGSKTPDTSDNKTLLIIEVNIGVVEEVRSEFSFHKNIQLESYAEELTKL